MSIYAQEPEIVKDSIQPILMEDVQGEPVKYPSDIRDFYQILYSSINYDLLEAEDKKSFLFYVKFAVDENGKPIDIQPEQINRKHPLFLDVSRVLSETKWIPGTDGQGNYQKKYVVLPIEIE